MIKFLLPVEDSIQNSKFYIQDFITGEIVTGNLGMFPPTTRYIGFGQYMHFLRCAHSLNLYNYYPKTTLQRIALDVGLPTNNVTDLFEVLRLVLDTLLTSGGAASETVRKYLSTQS